MSTDCEQQRIAMMDAQEQSKKFEEMTKEMTKLIDTHNREKAGLSNGNSADDLNAHIELLERHQKQLAKAIDDMNRMKGGRKRRTRKSRAKKSRGQKSRAKKSRTRRSRK